MLHFNLLSPKFIKPDPPKIKRKPPENICHAKFSSKAVEMINLPFTFNSTNFNSSLLTNKCNFATTTAVYDLTAPIRFKTFNFNNFVSELEVDQFLADPTNCLDIVINNLLLTKIMVTF